MKKIINRKSATKSGGKILGGALVGAALGVAAEMLFVSESGKKMQKDMKKLSVDFYRRIAPKMKRLKQLGEAEYHAFVQKGAEQYAKAKRLSLAEGNLLAAEAKRSWTHLKKHLQ